MFLVKKKPTSPALRHRRWYFYPRGFFWWSKKTFVFYTKKRNMGGRNDCGKRVLKTRGWNRYTHYITYDKKRLWSEQLGLVTSFTFNQMRRVLCICKFANGSISSIRAAHGLLMGSYVKTIVSKFRIFSVMLNLPLLGCRLLLKFLEVGNLCFEVQPNNAKRFLIACSNGTYCRILEVNRSLNVFLIQLPSRKKQYIYGECFVTVGRVANCNYKYVVVGAAGPNIRSGWKPKVRGVAMNPVDHPHGGRTKTNKPEVSPWGWVTKHSH